jgi:hypothetical protein
MARVVTLVTLVTHVTLVTLVTRLGLTCDSENAHRYWVCHTCHTCHTFFLSRSSSSRVRELRLDRQAIVAVTSASRRPRRY